MGKRLHHPKVTSSSAGSPRVDRVAPTNPAKIDGAHDALKDLVRKLAQQAAREVFASASAARAQDDASQRPTSHVAP
ncbi:MAG: hypothetical protein MUF65_10625 [Rubritepida sp.]|jgi:hypothetical protein|nr:hypothetical protein [Rubritepida sp.]